MEKRSMARGERPYRSKLKPYIAGHVCSVYAALQSQEACEHLLWHVHMHTIASEKRRSHAYKTSSEPAPCIAPRHVCPDIINSHQSSLQAGQLRIAQTRHNQLNPIYTADKELLVCRLFFLYIGGEASKHGKDNSTFLDFQHAHQLPAGIASCSCLYIGSLPASIALPAKKLAACSRHPYSFSWLLGAPCSRSSESQLSSVASSPL